MRKESLAISLAVHLAAIGTLALLQLAAPAPGKPSLPSRTLTKLIPPPPPLRDVRRPSPRDSGGGDRSPFPASKGAPPRAVTREFIPPQIARIENPRLAIQTGVEDVPKLNAPPGDPLGRNGVPSLGPGIDGIGGPGDFGNGPGHGGPGPRGAATYTAKPTKWPELIHKNEPEYSEDARKLRQQGTVILAVDIGVDGRPQNIRIVRGLGMGLDEKAMDAVSTWRFRPALSNGRPVAAPIVVEVNFRLL
jgi:TonB family protein